MNAIIGNINGCNEDHINSKGEMLLIFCSNNKLEMTNTFLPHKLHEEKDWTNIKGQSSEKDYVITNRSVILVLASTNISKHRIRS